MKIQAVKIYSWYLQTPKPCDNIVTIVSSGKSGRKLWQHWHCRTACIHQSHIMHMACSLCQRYSGKTLLKVLAALAFCHTYSICQGYIGKTGTKLKLQHKTFRAAICINILQST